MVNPFDRFDQPASNPFDRFDQAPTPEMAQPPAGVGADVVKSAGAGVIKGISGLVGLPRSVAELGYEGTRWLASKAGIEGPPVGDTFDALPSAKGTQGVIERNVTGSLHEPKTTLGAYAQTAGEMLPNAAFPGTLALRAANVVAPAVASETAGQLTKGTAAEPWARLAGAVAGGAAAPRVVSPAPVSTARARNLEVLEAEGIPVSAGQRGDSRSLQYLESTLGDAPGAGRQAQRAMDTQGEAFTRAVLRRVGEDAPRATPEVVDRAFQRIGGEFDRLSAAHAIAPDPRLTRAVTTTVTEYMQSTPAAARAPIVQNFADDILQRVTGNQPMPGDVYQAWRSRLDRLARGTGDNELRTALHGLRNSLDDAMERALPQADAEAWRDARRQYRNMIVVEKAATAASAHEGILAPSALRGALIAQGRRAYARGAGELGELVYAADNVLKPLPNSGTAQRLQAFAQMGATGSAMMGNFLPAMGLGAQAIGGRALMSRPGQALMGNQLAGPDPRRVPIWFSGGAELDRFSEEPPR